MSEELKCPVCGSDNLKRSWYNPDDHAMHIIRTVMCCGCGRSKDEDEWETLDEKETLTLNIKKLEAERDRLQEALAEAVEKYGKPGGPWNVPGEPGSWIDKAHKALEGVENATRSTN